jgi:hypothetical protein
MDWETTYQTASERHRTRARSAHAARLMYAAALQERAAELLEAEIVWGVPPVPTFSPVGPGRIEAARGWVMTASGLNVQQTT